MRQQVTQEKQAIQDKQDKQHKQAKQDHRTAPGRHSIRRQMTAIFIGVIALTFLCCGLANALFLGKYYLREKRAAIISAYQVLNEGAEKGQLQDEELTSKLELICNTDNISIFVMNSSGEALLWTNRDYQQLQMRLYNNIFEQENPDTPQVLEVTDTYVLRENRDNFTQADYLELLGNLDTGEPFIMQTALESIRESAAISNRFFITIVVFALLLSSLVIWWLSRKITKPIMELTHISRRMTELDFDAKFTSASGNEIGILGENMNRLSEKLETTISELKTANNELLSDIEQKTRIDEMRKDFISNVSHELKTPIALIQGYAEGLKECINDDAESRDFYCEVIMDEASKMNKMVRNLLSLNQLESGSELVTLERFDLTALIRNVLNSAGILLEQKEIQVNFREEDEVSVWADEFRIEEVVTNYVSNAINHCEGEKLIEIKLVREGDVIRTSVFNTGSPIPEEDLDKIWQKFYKVDKARTREYGGSGIGLSIVKAIMDSLHQQCGVRNYDNGVEFWFELDAGANEGLRQR